MGELAYAMGVLRNLPQNVVIECPNGRYSFAGSVSAELRFITRDGGTPTAEQIENARSFGPNVAGLRSRTWDTREGAIAAAESLGVAWGETVNR